MYHRHSGVARAPERGRSRCAAFSPIGASRCFSRISFVRRVASLVHQSLHAAEAKTGTNGDGFGIGWYGERSEPGLYREIRPAWSDENLPLPLRSGSLGPVLRPCARIDRHLHHPRQLPSLRAWPHLFMHNGQIGGYARIKRRSRRRSRTISTTRGSAPRIWKRSSWPPWRTD